MYWVYRKASGEFLHQRIRVTSNFNEAGVFDLEQLDGIVQGMFNGNWEQFFANWCVIPAVMITTESTMRTFHPVATYAIERHKELVDEVERAVEREKEIKVIKVTKKLVKR